MAAIELHGVSWDHPRGHDCMVDTAEAYKALHPEMNIVWQTRSLQDFADFPVERLAERYDLLVIDHPFVGFAAADGCLLPLDEIIDAAILADQAANSVGPSHRSYHCRDHQWALATDAAGHVSAYRPDLIEEVGGVPRTWDEVLALAERQSGKERAQVANPLIPIDALMSFCSLCAALDDPPFQGPNHVVGRATGREALHMLETLKHAAHPESLKRNPPRTLDLMSTSDEIAYVPLLFGYSNYGRPGFRPNLVRFTGVPTFGGGQSRGGILGGGGQPGHRAAWLDARVNGASSGFFADTLDNLDRAFLRPHYNGFMAAQERSGELVHAWLADGGSADGLLDQLDALYRASEPLFS